jgi:hypothetical protein
MEPVRRLEVFTGAGRRRKWSEEDKARIVAEFATNGDRVSSVARRHGYRHSSYLAGDLSCGKKQLQLATNPKRAKCSLCQR